MGASSRGRRAHRPARPRAGLGAPGPPGPHRSGGDARPHGPSSATSASRSRRMASARLVGIGVAVPSPVDPAHPDRLSEVVLPGWQRKQRASRCSSQRYGVPADRGQRRQPGRAGRALVGRRPRRRRLRLHQGRDRRRLGARHRRPRSTAAPPASPARSGTWPSTRTASPASAACAAASRRWSARRRWCARARAARPSIPDSVLAGGELTIDRDRGRGAGRRRARAAARRARRPRTWASRVAGLLNLMNPALVILGGGLARLGDAAARAAARDASAAARCVSSLVGLPRSGPASWARGRWRSAPPRWCSRPRSPTRASSPPRSRRRSRR